MGKVKRVTCIATPMLLTGASLVCFVVVMFGQSYNTSLARHLYFFKADTSSITLDAQSMMSNLFNIDVPDALRSEAKSGHLNGFYQVGLFDYCEGDIDTVTGRQTVTHCSAWKLPFHFDPVTVWQLKNTSVLEILGERFEKGMETYGKAVEWMHWVFIFALTLNVVEFGVGMCAIFSRWGSFWTTIASALQTVLAIVAAAAATGIYVTLMGVFESVLRPYNIEASLGARMFCVLWIGVAFSVASSFFWLVSVCCCSGK
ncbi:Integral membrane protein [Pyrenophora tritici-repentis]|nr:Integral membrane protein [Pyrenophora tritici-repentis]